jgi:hypothetical protein
MWGSIKLVFRFIVQMLVAGLLFAIVGGVTYVLWLGSEWLQNNEAQSIAILWCRHVRSSYSF